jgi:phosphoenolpyruvate-protein phosphotransferase (PTS system enzyme I)
VPRRRAGAGAPRAGGRRGDGVIKTTQQETHLRGVALSDGVAVARVCLFNENRHSNLPVYKVSGEGVERELARLDRARTIAHTTLEGVRNKVREAIGPPEAGIFDAQLMILDDPQLAEKTSVMIRDRAVNAETAVAVVLDEYETRLQAVDNEYLRERASDFGEIKRRLLDELRNMRPAVQCSEAHCQRGRNRIIVAEELTPQMTVDLDTGHTMGFVTERGGRNAHAAILARALGIPAVSGLEGIRDRVACGSEILVNGTTGDVILWPRERTVLQYHAATTPDMIRRPEPVDPVPGLCVMANISLAAEAHNAVEMKAEGIGLYRTEIELIAGGAAGSEDALFACYRSVLETMDGRPVAYRLFDLGSDKTLPDHNLPGEANPALGLRGARLLLRRNDLLRDQARALARTAALAPIRVLYPMIIDRAQFLLLKERFLAAVEDIPHGRIEHGIMLEVPAACLQARELLDVADFASVGTNDLTQYLLAVDRDNPYVADDYVPDHPALLTLLEQVAAVAKDLGKPLAVCGEIAGDPAHLPRLLAAGIRSVSVSARMIPSVRGMARHEFEADSNGRQDEKNT